MNDTHNSAFLHRKERAIDDLKKIVSDYLYDEEAKIYWSEKIIIRVLTEAGYGDVASVWCEVTGNSP